MTTKDSTPVTYGDAAHKHAVSAGFGNSYTYDANGNQTSRNIGGTVFTFTYDYENRLTAITGGATASFVYDADGNRVKSTVGTVTTVYIAGVYEYQGGATTKYYEGNAMRRSGYGGTEDGVFYLLQDHLKSSSSFVDQSGTTLSTNYYLPYGGNRGAAFSSLSTKRFTGQYHEKDLPGGEGLSYYNARWYDAKLGRFLSADTIVPGPANPQTFNRYSYVINNPLRFVDPTGHSLAEIDPGGGGGSRPPRPSSVGVVTCAGMGCFTPMRPRTPVLSQYPSMAFPRKPAVQVKQSTTWTDRLVTNTRSGLPVAKALTKKFWGCAIGSCAASMNDWTGSIDAGGMWSPLLVAARGTISIAVDHEGGIAVVISGGGGGSTPTINAGVGATFTNAPSVNKLAGYSVQAGGSIDAGVGVMAEGVFFSDSDTNQKYAGLSVSAVGSFPDPLIASVHGTFEHSWIPAKGNVFDWFFYPLEWVLKEK